MELAHIAELREKYSKVEQGCDYDSTAMQEFVLCAEKLMPHLLEAVEIVRSNYVGDTRAEALLAKLKG